jgi:hypothetical protein
LTEIGSTRRPELSFRKGRLRPGSNPRRARVHATDQQLVAVPIIEQNVQQARALAKELLDHIGLSIPRLGDALPLPKFSI